MKKLLLLCLMGMFLISSCDKAILKRTTVRVIDERASISVDYPNDAKKYLNQYSEAELKAMYIKSFKDELGKRKIDLVDGPADYVITIGEIDLDEYVVSEYEDNQWFELSTITAKVHYTYIAEMEDVPNEIVVEMECEEELKQEKEKKEDKYGNKKDGDWYIAGFGGVEGALEDHAEESRKEFKSIFKSRQ